MSRQFFSLAVFLLIGLTSAKAQSAQPADSAAKKGYEVAVYYFPNYHVDKRNEKHFEKGWSEWKLVKEAKPRFAGHQQPKVPLWGYTDEASPVEMARKIEAASSHGINAFIYDWYYYDDGLFLERGLEEGFMEAKNNNLMKFSLMWANHDWVDIHPYTFGEPQTLLYPGKITAATWEKMTDYIITKYFKHPSYWLIDGAPYFSVYDLSNFLQSFGSADGAAKALATFRQKTKAAGFKDLHLNAVVWGNTILPGEQAVADPARVVKELGFSSVTSYVWIHHVPLDKFPANEYDTVKNKYLAFAVESSTKYNVPYYPNVSMGWDASPRTNQSKEWSDHGYPYMPVIVNNTPKAFKKALQEVKAIMDTTLTQNKILTINSWNEWTEGSYLEPDTKNKYAYLEAIKAVFK